MTLRVLIAIDWNRLCIDKLNYLKKFSTIYDELICVIEDADELPNCGLLLVHLKQILTSHIKKPFYLLPMARKGVAPLTNWLRWRILSPPFVKAFTDKHCNHSSMTAAWKIPVEIFPEQQGGFIPSLFSKDQQPQPPLMRGLFITRAQPFHIGHAAIIDQMSQELDEVIVVIAKANLSHTLLDIATGGERLAMLQPFMHEMLPNRHYLVALPYSSFSLENFYELELMLPSFNTVHTHNPSVASLAITAGYPVKTHSIPYQVSASQIRENITKDLPYEHLLPLTVCRFLKESEIPNRLKALASGESR